MTRQIQFRIGWENCWPTSKLPSELVGIPGAPEIRQPTELSGIGALTLLDDTVGDQHGGLWDATLVGILSFASGVTSSMVASWLYDRVKQGRAKTLTINKRHVVVEKEVIRAVIEEETIEQSTDTDD